MTAYYNEIDPYAAQWLRNLIAAGYISAGDVDTRSIVDVRPDDLKGYTQCHFFAGIGGWSLALRLALWDDSRPVWTGSCPCQPFSVAGSGKAQKDERHLWPHWFRLIAAVRPSVVFGEQVAGAIAHGWLDDTFDDLEGEGYQTGAVVLPACSVGAPHKRDRLWFVGDSKHNGSFATTLDRITSEAGEHNPQRKNKASESTGTSRPRSDEHVANPTSERPQRQGKSEQSLCSKATGNGKATLPESSGASDFWAAEPPLGRVANGIPARAHKLRAYGNAIVPQVAAEFIKATT